MTDDRHVRPFGEFLTAQRRGRLHNELSDVLAELTAAVVEHGRPGQLALTIKVAPAAKHAENVVTITDKVVVKVPEAERGTAIWFVDGDGGLHRNNPNQQELPLRAIAGDRDPDDAEEASNQ